jgi:hypothetical protein
MESPFPVGQEFFFAGTSLPSCSLATDIHVTIFIGENRLRRNVVKENEHRLLVSPAYFRIIK